MTAKNFLLQIKKIDRLIENKLAECEQLKSIATEILKLRSQAKK